MADVKPKSKVIDYEMLSAQIDYVEHRMIITNKETGETISIPARGYPELQAIMSDVGHQASVPLHR